MKSRSYTLISVALIALLGGVSSTIFLSKITIDGDNYDQAILDHADRLIEEGKNIFQNDTFGDEAFWTDRLRLHEVIAGEALGGTGAGLTPEAALTLGFKIDTESLPQEILDALAQGQVDLQDPGVTLTLIKEDAVVGVKGTFSGDDLTAVGLTCAFCHAIVDDSFAPGLGKRLNGWANRDLDVGTIISLTDVTAIADLLGADNETVRTVLQSWGPGKFDAELLLDGKTFRPDGGSAATLIPPTFGLAGVNLHTWTGWGSMTHWNGLVSNLELNGQGTFFDPRLDDAEKFPIAAREGFGHTRSDPDLITSKLAALHLYQLAMPAPKPPEGTFDPALAAAGEILFNDKAQCATCHVPPIFTEPGYNMHTPEEIGIDAFQANRSPDGRYRTAPLKGIWTHTTGGFYHDGRFTTLDEVVEHYNGQFNLGLSDEEKLALVQYQLSLGDEHVATGTANESPSIPTSSFLLNQNYPNPFSDETTITYHLEQPGDVMLEIYTVTGQRVRQYVIGTQASGDHAISWDGLDSAGKAAASGVYFYRLGVDKAVNTQKMILLR